MARRERAVLYTTEHPRFTLDNQFEEAVAARGHSVGDVLADPTLMRRPRQAGSRELLRLDALPDQAWRQFDDMIVTEGAELLSATAATQPLVIENPLGTTEIEVPTVDSSSDTNEGMNPDAVNDEERLDFSSVITPVPYTWIDYEFPAQLDATKIPYVAQVVQNGMRAVMGSLERKYFTGCSGTYNGREAEGLSDSNITSTAAGNGGKWNAAGKTGGQYQRDLNDAQSRLVADERYGQLNLFCHPTVYVHLANDYSSEYPGTIRSRLTDSGVRIMPSVGIATASNVYLVEASGGTVKWATAIAPSVIQWVSPSGFLRHVLVIAKAAPVVVPTYSGKYGVQIIT